MAECVPGIYDLPSHDPQGTKNNLFPRKQSTSALQWAFYDPIALAIVIRLGLIEIEIR